MAKLRRAHQEDDHVHARPEHALLEVQAVEEHARVQAQLVQVLPDLQRALGTYGTCSHVVSCNCIYLYLCIISSMWNCIYASFLASVAVFMRHF